MESLLVSTLIVAIAEIGDKTQLLALLLASRFRQPLAVIAGIAVATLANHAIAAWFGAVAADWLSSGVARGVLGLSFLAMAVWVLIPDRMDEEHAPATRRHGAFVTTLVCFFLVEIGDKTQVATVALAAHYEAVILVTMGTTLGMLLSNVPVVMLGDRAAKAIPLRVVRVVASVMFALLGLLAVLDVGLTGLLG